MKEKSRQTFPWIHFCHWYKALCHFNCVLCVKFNLRPSGALWGLFSRTTAVSGGGFSSLHTIHVTLSAISKICHLKNGAHIHVVVIPAPFTWFECKYPQIKAESRHVKHILFHFESIVVVYRAKNCVNVQIFMGLTVYSLAQQHETSHPVKLYNTTAIREIGPEEIDLPVLRCTPGRCYINKRK